jgi:phage tail-like protein
MPTAGKQHYLLDGRAGWRDSLTDKTVVADGVSLRLRPLPGPPRPIVDAAGSFGNLAYPAGVAVDVEDRVYILDGAACLVKRFDPCGETFHTLPCIGGKGSAPRQLCDPHGIAVSCRDDLYLADAGNRRVQVFALKGLPLRAIWGPFQVTRDASGIHVAPAVPARPVPAQGPDCETQPAYPEGTWQPWDVAVSCKCVTFVSDYASGLIHVFDAGGIWRAAWTGEGNGAPPLEKPTAIALDAKGRLYVVQEGKDYVAVLDGHGKFERRIERPDEAEGEFCPISVAADNEGNLWIGERLTRRIYLYAQNGAGDYHCICVCPGFDGFATALGFDRAGNPLAADAAQKIVARMTAQAGFETEGRFFTTALDSHLYRCPWHRVAMRAVIPPGTHVRVDTLTAESLRADPDVQQMPDDRWATGQVNSAPGQGEWDCLIQSPPGRYLWLRLTLTGEGPATPEVREARIYYPRASSRQYLPATYSEDAASRDFLDRFLSIFDTLRGGIGDKIGNIALYFDPGATPAAPSKPGQTDFLTWLASWLDLALDRHWPEEKRRELVRQAHRLYALRGTPEGLRLHVKLYAGVEPRILEHYRLRRWLYLDHGRLGDQSALYGKAVVARLQLDEYSKIGEFQLTDAGDPLRDPFHFYAHRFTVYLPVRAAVSDMEKQTLLRIIEMAKPAHTKGDLRFAEPRFRVGVQAFVGMDTILGDYPDRVVMGEGTLGYDTVLGPSEDESGPPTMRVGVRARIGSSTLMD